MIAFWSYDIFPYCLSGEVTGMSTDNKVFVKGYEGYRIKPIIILPDDEGLKIKNYLDTLRREYQMAQSELLKEFSKKASEIAPFISDLK